jgi:hypothetical protein
MITYVTAFWDVTLCIVSYVLTDVSEERAASIFKVDESGKIGKYLPGYNDVTIQQRLFLNAERLSSLLTS